MAGSDNRQRYHQYLVRLTHEEWEDISAKADNAGMTPAAFFRQAALGTPVTTTIPIDPAIARCIDAGLLNTRLPRALEHAARRLITTATQAVR